MAALDNVIAQALQEVAPAQLAVSAPELAVALLWIIGFLLALATLHLVLPAEVVKGYVLDRHGKPLTYRLNGFRVHVVGILAAALLTQHGYLDGTYVARNIWPLFVASNVVGLGFTLLFYVYGLAVPSTIDRAYVAPTVGRPAPVTDKVAPKNPSSGSGRGVLYDLYSGFSFNPRAGSIDIKMFLYLYGAVLIQLIVLSTVYTAYVEQGQVSLALATFSGLLSYFVLEYDYHEHVHLYTYDIFAEKIGFKLTWGCMVFYPFFYTVTARALLAAPSATISPAVAALAVLVFLTGYILSRGANNQKYAFRVNPNQPYLFGLVQQRAIPGSRILCSGWWGLARHINYLGEMLMATGIVLSAAVATGSWLPWTYPLYYVALLVPRDLEDNRICAAKYGAKWAEYCRLVPYRILPGIY